MSEINNTKIQVTEIKLHKKSHLLEMSFSNGENYKLSCEYLRTHAKSAEITSSELPVFGKAEVNIDQIEAQGDYALRLCFDDGYESGIYSWETLYDLAKNYQQNWDSYLAELEKHGLKRETKQSKKGPIKLKLLYFMDKLIATTQFEEEEIELSENISRVEDLLALLRQRGMRWERDFAEDAIQVTVNKEFVELFTVLDDGDEVAFIPRPK